MVKLEKRRERELGREVEGGRGRERWTKKDGVRKREILWEGKRGWVYI